MECNNFCWTEIILKTNSQRCLAIWWNNVPRCKLQLHYSANQLQYILHEICVRWNALLYVYIVPLTFNGDGIADINVYWGPQRIQNSARIMQKRCSFCTIQHWIEGQMWPMKCELICTGNDRHGGKWITASTGVPIQFKYSRDGANMDN